MPGASSDAENGHAIGSVRIFRHRAAQPALAWSAVSPDGKTVALTVWDDELGPDGSYDCFGRADRSGWVDRIGNRDRNRNLQHAIDNCDGIVRVVRVTAANTNAGTRSIKQRRADPDARMKIVRLNRETGEFRAELLTD